MNHPPHVVRQYLILELFGPEGTSPIEAELRYDPADPYAVAVVFLMAGHEVTWVFARDLLIRGVQGPVGDGDVVVFPSLDDDGSLVVGLELSSPQGRALVEAKAHDVVEFLARTRLEVWPGTEGDYLKLDEEIAAILVED